MSLCDRRQRAATKVVLSSVTWTKTERVAEATGTVGDRGMCDRQSIDFGEM